MHTDGGEHPNDEGMGKGGAEAKQRGLGDGAANGDDEGGHHRLAVAGLQAVERAEQDRGGEEQPALALREVILE